MKSTKHWVEEVINLVKQHGFHVEVLPSTSIFDAIAWLQSPRVSFGTPTFNERVWTLQKSLRLTSAKVSNTSLEKFASILKAKIHVWVVKGDLLDSHYETVFQYESTVNLLSLDSEFYPMIALASTPRFRDEKEQLLQRLVSLLSEVQKNPSHSHMLRSKLEENFRQLFRMDPDSAHALSLNVRELEPVFNRLRKENRLIPTTRESRTSDTKRGPKLSRITPGILGPRARGVYNSHLSAIKQNGFFNDKITNAIASFCWFFIELKSTDVVPPHSTHIFGAEASHLEILDFDLGFVQYFHFSPTTILDITGVQFPDWSVVHLPHSLKSLCARGSNFNGDLSTMTSLTCIDLRAVVSNDWSTFRFPPNLKEVHLENSNFTGEMVSLNNIEIFDNRRIINVEGSGSECCNGRYFEDGSKLGMPRFVKYWIAYEHSTSFLKVTIYRQASSKTGELYWWISGKLYSRKSGEVMGKMSLYYTKSNRDLPPTSGWKKLRDGEAPTPKLLGINFALSTKKKKTNQKETNDTVKAPDLRVPISDAKKMSIHSEAPSSISDNTLKDSKSFNPILALFDDSAMSSEKSASVGSPHSFEKRPLLLESTASLMQIAQEYANAIQESVIKSAEIFAVHESIIGAFETLASDCSEERKFRRSMKEQQRILRELLQLNDLFAEKGREISKMTKTLAEDAVELHHQIEIAEKSSVAIASIEGPSSPMYHKPQSVVKEPVLQVSHGPETSIHSTSSMPLTNHPTQSNNISIQPSHIASHNTAPMNSESFTMRDASFRSATDFQTTNNSINSQGFGHHVAHNSSFGHVSSMQNPPGTRMVNHRAQPSMMSHSSATSPIPPTTKHMSSGEVQSNVTFLGHSSHPSAASTISFLGHSSQPSIGTHASAPSIVSSHQSFSRLPMVQNSSNNPAFARSPPIQQLPMVNSNSPPFPNSNSTVSFVSHSTQPSIASHQSAPSIITPISRVPGVVNPLATPHGVRAPNIIRAKPRRNPQVSRSMNTQQVFQKKWCQVLERTLARRGIEMASEPIAFLARGEKVLVAQIHGRRARIEHPFAAWVSMFTTSGVQILEHIETNRPALAE